MEPLTDAKFAALLEDLQRALAEAQEEIQDLQERVAELEKYHQPWAFHSGSDDV